jgi:microcystin-dependent protein
MAIIDFPNSPTLNQVFTSGLASYQWDGVKWIPYPATLVDAPLDGNLYERKSGTWNLDPIQMDAPSDTHFYSRKSLAWSANPIQTDAPNDGNIYGRFSLGWSNISSQYALTTYVNAGDVNTLTAAKAYADGEAVPIGAIIMYGSSVAPTNFLNCDGSVYNVSTYPKLAAILGAAFGGNGSTTFAVPNLNQSRFPIGTPSVGAQGGAGTVTLSMGNIPPHAFTVPAHTHAADSPGHNHGDFGHSHGASQDAHNHSVASWTAPGGLPVTGSPAFYTQGGITATTSAAQPNVYIAEGAANISVTAVGVNVYANGPWATNTLGGGAAFAIYPPYTGVNFIIRYQ